MSDRPTATWTSDDRAQSEVLGFVMVFGLIVAAIALVTTTGFAGLLDTQEAQQANNAVQALQVLADNGEEVAGGAPVRSTEIELANARLSFERPVTIRVSGERVSDPSENFTVVRQVTPLVYEGESGTRVVYVNGALLRVERDGTVMIEDPGSMLSREATVLTVQRVHPTSRTNVGGSRTVQVRMRRTGAELLASRTVPYDVTIEVDAPNAGVWKRHYDSNPDVSCTQTGSTTVECSLRTDRLFVSVVDVGVQFR